VRRRPGLNSGLTESEQQYYPARVAAHEQRPCLRELRSLTSIQM
jgi:hypothetical protein